MKYVSKSVCLILIISLITTLFLNVCSNAETVYDINAAISAKESDDYIDYLKNGVDYTGASIKIDASGFSKPNNSSAHISEYNGRKNVLLLDSESGYVTWNVECEKAGLYQVSFEYSAIDDSESRIELSCEVNGVVPFKTADSMFLPRVWVNSGEPSVDSLGNQSSPTQVQQPTWVTEYLVDPDGLYLEPLKFNFNAGINTFAVKLYSGSIALSAIFLSESELVNDYSTDNTVDIYNGDDIIIEAQDAVYKSSKELRPLSDKTDPSVTPSSAYYTCLNSIGGSNWDSAGEKISWEVQVPKSGYYSITFKYKQNYLTNASSIRGLKVDGKTPFTECKAIAFPYTTKWDLMTFGNDSPYYIYLKEGTRILSLEVTLGDVADISRRLEELIFNVGVLYRQIIMITGTSPDPNRDYRLYEQIPSLNEDLQNYIETINQLVDEYNAITGASGGSNAVTLEGLARVLNSMLKSKFKAHKYVSDLFNNYCSAGAWIYEMRKMPLTLEKIILGGEKVDTEKYQSSFIDRLVFGFKKLVASYTVDYNLISVADGENTIDVWVNIGRDQSKVLQKMVEDTFTPQSGVSVNIKIASATIIQAKLSGNAPDCTIMQAQDVPVNLAMRGALYDLSQFEDFAQVVKSNYENEDPITPFKYKNGVYGLPDTVSYNMMYIRDDIFEQLELEVPKTWDDFLRCSVVIMRNNLSVGIPAMHTTFLYQYGGTLYTEDLTETNLRTEESFKAFDFFTDLYVKYKFPLTFSFYNRFRTGEMPLGIDSYTTYATLMAAASEISGCWSVHPLPGVESENGVNNTVVGSATAAVILKDTDKPDAAWEFLKWWTGNEAQFRYSSDIESIVGIAARHPTANIKALQQLSWNRDDAKTIVTQYRNAEFIPEVPGSYYVTRSLENAFYNVYTDGDGTKDSLSKWSRMIDEEMSRKRKEYSRED